MTCSCYVNTNYHPYFHIPKYIVHKAIKILNCYKLQKQQSEFSVFDEKNATFYLNINLQNGCDMYTTQFPNSKLKYFFEKKSINLQIQKKMTYFPKLLDGFHGM